VGGQIGIMLHVFHQFQVMVIGHDNGTSALNGAHDTRDARSGANLENVLVPDQLVGPLLDVV
jgi:hypothetical protein